MAWKNAARLYCGRRAVPIGGAAGLVKPSGGWVGINSTGLKIRQRRVRLIHASRDSHVSLCAVVSQQLRSGARELAQLGIPDGIARGSATARAQETVGVDLARALICHATPP